MAGSSAELWEVRGHWVSFHYRGPLFWDIWLGKTKEKNNVRPEGGEEKYIVHLMCAGHQWYVNEQGIFSALSGLIAQNLSFIKWMIINKSLLSFVPWVFIITIHEIVG